MSVSSGENSDRRLPNGWRAYISKTFPDRVYYFNKHTGATTWELPELQNSDTGISLSPSSSNTSLSQENVCTMVLKKTAVSPTTLPTTTQRKLAFLSESSHNKDLSSTESIINAFKLNLKTESLLSQTRIINHPILKTHKRKLSGDESVAQKTLGNEIEENKWDTIEIPVSFTITDKTNGMMFSEAISDVEMKMEEDDDVEMEDISDWYETIKSKDIKDPEQRFHIVVDTNILIHHLEQLADIKDTPIPGHGLPLILIPWVVIQELDVLKSSKTKCNTVIFLAKVAVKYINSMLHAQHPRFQGQSGLHVATKFDTSEINDDSILRCCLELANKIGHDQVLLLTEDTNLCNKSLIHKIQTSKMEALLKKIEFGLLSRKPKGFASFCHYPKYCSVDNESEHSVDLLVCQAKLVLKESLGQILEQEMKTIFGDKWLFSIKIKPPWSLLNILTCLIKHWLAVFSLVFNQNSVRDLIQDIKNELDETKGYIHEFERGQAFVIKASSLVTIFHSTYKCLSEAVHEMEGLCGKFQALTTIKDLKDPFLENLVKLK